MTISHNEEYEFCLPLGNSKKIQLFEKFVPGVRDMSILFIFSVNTKIQPRNILKVFMDRGGVETVVSIQSFIVGSKVKCHSHIWMRTTQILVLDFPAPCLGSAKSFFTK